MDVESLFRPTWNLRVLVLFAMLEVTEPFCIMKLQARTHIEVIR